MLGYRLPIPQEFLSFAGGLLPPLLMATPNREPDDGTSRAVQNQRETPTLGSSRDHAWVKYLDVASQTVCRS